MTKATLTASLEDYLETILELTKERPVARVRDIAAARNVKPGSVSPAMKRLDTMGLINYERNDFISLTDTGLREARRVQARHDVLTRFFADVLMMERKAAETEACAMEHHLSNEAMDRLVRFFEFLEGCPDSPGDFLDRFHACCLLGNRGTPACNTASCPHMTTELAAQKPTISVADLEPGQIGSVVQINAAPAIRQRLLDMGILPQVEIQMERTTLTGDPVWLRVDDYQISLRREEARSIQVRV